jgi:hypothetical protein
MSSMRRWKQWLTLALIASCALWLRWTGLDWDGYNHYHPDERYITWVATTVAWPSDLRSAFDPHVSPLNPFYWPPDAASPGIVVLQDEQRDFAYGHVPLYLGVAATRLAEWIGPAARGMLPEEWLLTADIFNGRDAIEFRHLTAVTRALTGLVDLLTILTIFWLGRRLFNPAVGLLAAAFLALNVMHIQLSHFFTADPYLTFFVTAALALLVRSLYAARAALPEAPNQPAALWRCGQTCSLLLAGLFIGLAVGAKFSAVLLVLPLLVTVYLGPEGKRARLVTAVLLVAALVFAVTNPFALLDWTCTAVTPALSLGPLQVPALDWGNCYLQNVLEQSAMVSGRADLGFTRQYEGTLPYLYPVEMQLRWGMGWALGLVAFAAFAWVSLVSGWTLWHERRESLRTLPVRTAGLLVLLAWALPFFLTTGGFFVKFMRYVQPITPLLMLFAAALLLEWRNRLGALALSGLVLALTAFYALAFVQIYNVSHPWEAASTWVYDNVPRGALLAGEQWDDALPTSMLLEGELRRRGEYRESELTWLSEPDELDDEGKLVDNLARLESADYVTVVSNRVYGVVPRLPERFLLSSAYHQLLFDGSLGYEPVYVGTRMPTLFGLTLQPDAFVWPGLRPPATVEAMLGRLTGLNGGRFDESFTVYDQPLVMIFQNVERKTAVEMRSLFPAD